MEGRRSAAPGCVGEQQLTGLGGSTAETLIWTDHDRLPEGGEWLFVVNRRRWEEGREDGAWVRADLDPEQVAPLLTSLLEGQPGRGDLLVVDQLGLEEMVDEDHFAPERLV